MKHETVPWVRGLTPLDNYRIDTADNADSNQQKHRQLATAISPISGFSFLYSLKMNPSSKKKN